MHAMLVLLAGTKRMAVHEVISSQTLIEWRSLELPQGADCTRMDVLHAGRGHICTTR